MSKKQVYVKPQINKLEQGHMNKFGASPEFARNPRPEIDGLSIQKLVEKHGSPLFVFSEQDIRSKIAECRQAYRSRYPNVDICWSYKTNYLDAICKIFIQEGCLSEVVSEMEYQKARRLGVPGSDILFNGPNKSKEILQLAVKEKAKIHIDNFEEIVDIEEVASGKKKPEVAIRLNLDCGIQPLWTRFGFNLESGQALEAVKRIQLGGKLNLVGLHCHIGTFILDPVAYQIQVRKMIDFMKVVEKETDFTIQYLDIGGGHPSKSKLKGTYLAPELLIQPIDNYAEAIASVLLKELPSNRQIKIYLENGRALIDEAGYLITTIQNSKRLPDGLKTYVCDVGVNLLYTATWYKFKIELEKVIQGQGELSLLNGPLCMNIDIIDEGVLLPPLKRGDRLILSPVGAYNVTQWMQFIELRPAIVLIDQQGNDHVIRCKETLEDMSRNEQVPEHLRK